MKKKYTFAFSEMQYGSISIESDKQPTDEEVIEAIIDGNAYYHDTEWTDISLVEEAPIKTKSERSAER